MPTYNAAAFLAGTIESILSQDHENFNLIISDDASTDSTLDICERYAANDSRIRIHRHERRLGWIGNANRAFQHATGQYIMSMPHDDVMLPAYLSSCVAALQAKPSVVGAFSDTYLHYRDGRVELLIYDRLEGLTSSTERALALIRGGGPWWICYHGVFRKTAFEVVGGLRHFLGGEFTADSPWVLRFALQGEFVRVPRPLFRKYYRQSSLSRTWSYSYKNRLLVRLACAHAVFESGPGLTKSLPIYGALLNSILNISRGPVREYWWRAARFVRNIVYR